MSVISLSWPSFCVRLIFLRLFDAMIVSLTISWLCFLMSSLAFFFMVFPIYFGVYYSLFIVAVIHYLSSSVTMTVMSVTMTGLFLNFSLRYSVWAFLHPSPPCFLLKHYIHDFVFS